MMILVLISLILVTGCTFEPKEYPKTITTDEEAVEFARKELEGLCVRDSFDCSPFQDVEIITNELDEQSNSKYKWFIEFKDKNDPNKNIDFVVSEWGEREISYSNEFANSHKY